MKEHITIPVVVAFSLLLAACGNMESGIHTLATVQEKQETQLGSATDYGYHGYEEAADTSEEVIFETQVPAQPVKGEAVLSEDVQAGPVGQKKSDSKNNSKSDPPSEGPIVPKVSQSEMIGPGVLRPTVYYYPIINEDEKGCLGKEKRSLHGAGGKVLMKVCARTYAMCALQGTCGIVQNKVVHTFNIIGRFEGQDRFFEIPDDGCRFGYGVNSACLDPFYTLAADLTIYKPGEVIYVPAVVGLVLPDGSVHSGFFIIRDKGRGIKGLGRFDFFTGHYSWLNPENPFKKLGLGDVKTGIPYFRIKGEAAKRMQAHRAYPDLPRHAVTE